MARGVSLFEALLVLGIGLKRRIVHKKVQQPFRISPVPTVSSMMEEPRPTQTFLGCLIVVVQSVGSELNLARSQKLHHQYQA